MKRKIAFVLVLAVLALCALIYLRTESPAQTSHRYLRMACAGREPTDIREIKTATSGLREWVVEVFFRAEPGQIKQMLHAPPFQPDERSVEGIKGGNNSFTRLTGLPTSTALGGFIRSDLSVSSGKQCYVVADPSYTFAYITYIEF